MIELIGVHRFDDADIVHHAGQVGQHLRERRTALAVLRKLEPRPEHRGVGPDERITLAPNHRGRQRLAFQTRQLGLLVEQVELDGAPAMKRWITRLALGAKCGFLGASGFSGTTGPGKRTSAHRLAQQQ